MVDEGVDGTITVDHVTVTGLIDDGTDTLRNIEQLQFLDHLVLLGLSITSDGGGATATKSVAENTTAVTTVTATSSSPATPLSFFIFGGLDAAFFAIDDSGALSFQSARTTRSRWTMAPTTPTTWWCA